MPYPFQDALHDRSEEDPHAALFLELSELALDERQRRLAQIGSSDASLRERMESWLASHDSDLLRTPPSTGLLAAVHQEGETLVGRRLGEFVLFGLLGSGGSGTVYEAEQAGTRRRVALKVVNTLLSGREGELRFQREIQVFASLEHLGIARVYEAGVASTEIGRLPWVAMELVRGSSLTSHAEESALSLRARVELMARVCDAVAFAHGRGFVHRDLKPQNILVERASGQPKVLDFGLAKLVAAETEEVAEAAEPAFATETGRVLGTMAYMSPEQARGEARAVDARSDVYSLGVVLFELLAGRRPYETSGFDLASAARIVVETEAPRLGRLSSPCRGDLETIVGKALEKDGARRYASAAELAADLRRHLADQPIAARAPSAFDLARRFVRRHRALVATTAVIFLALAGGALATWLQARAATRARDEATRSAEIAEFRTYAAQIAEAHSALRARDTRSAREALQRTDPRFRNFEWWHLWQELDQSSATLSGINTVPHQLAISPDGERVGCVRFRQELCVFERREPERTPSITRSGVDITTWAFLREPDRALLAGSDGSLTIWNTRSGELVRSLRSAGSSALALAFDGEDRVLVVLELDGHLRRIDVSSGAERGDLELPEGQFLALEHSGELAALAHAGNVRIVDLRTGGTRAELPAKDGVIRAAAFADGGALFATASAEGTLHVFDTLLGSEIARYEAGAAVLALRFRPDGERLASGGEDSALKLWETHSPGTPPEVLVGHGRRISALEWSPDGRWLATISPDITLKIWNPGARRGSTWTADLIAFAAEVDLLGLARAGRLELIDIDSGTLRSSFEIGRADGLALSADGKRAAVSRDDDAVVFDVETGREITRFDLREAYVSISRSGRMLGFRIGPSRYVVLDVDSGGVLLDSPGYMVAIAPDERRVALAVGSEIRIRDLMTGEETAVLAGHGADLGALAWSRDGERLASGSTDRTVRIWDPATGGLHHVLRDCPSKSISLAFSADGERLAVGHFGRPLWIWAPERGERLIAIPCGDSGALETSFSREGTALLTVNSEARGEQAQLWRAPSRLSQYVEELLLREVAPSRIRRSILGDASRDPEFRQRAVQLLERRPRDAQRLNAEAWNLVCFAGGEAAAYARGLVLAEAAQELLPEDGYVLNTLGCAQYRNALFAIAYDTLKRAAEKNGAFPPDHSLLACVCVHLGRLEEARASLARAEAPLNGAVWDGAEPGALLAEARNLVASAR